MSPYRRQEECLSRKPGSLLTDTRRERTNYLELFNDHEMADSRTESNFGDIRGKYLFRHPEYAMLCKYRTNYIYTQHNKRGFIRLLSIVLLSFLSLSLCDPPFLVSGLSSVEGKCHSRW